MPLTLDQFDHAILHLLQRDASLPVDRIGAEVNLSRNAAWRRIKAMEAAGIIAGRVALVDPATVGSPLLAIVLIRTARHDDAWRDTFRKTLELLPEVVSAYRMTGDLDYVLRVRLADVQAYDTFYQRLTARVAVSDISASFVMQELKETTAVPL